eukprot:NODE_19710_length_831_cov_1.936080.p6 GENE.NODE_19710_length_831_cov_1.936080~~NODE_19710_length_831_cov_1.936080.p6  ORF type:complete len:89 (+),score=35.71 NODE_19710_length_831_cov_1.936080:141-407(+)
MTHTASAGSGAVAQRPPAPPLQQRQADVIDLSSLSPQAAPQAAPPLPQQEAWAASDDAWNMPFPATAQPRPPPPPPGVQPDDFDMLFR